MSPAWPLPLRAVEWNSAADTGSLLEAGWEEGDPAEIGDGARRAACRGRLGISASDFQSEGMATLTSPRVTIDCHPDGGGVSAGGNPRDPSCRQGDDSQEACDALLSGSSISRVLTVSA